MRRLMLWSAIAGFTACLNRPTLVAITPEYGYVDGCTEVIVSGHDLGVQATADLVGEAGSVPLELLPAKDKPKRPEWAQDQGFVYTATIPPAPDLASGFYDLVVVVEGEALTLNSGWYYRTCPQTFRFDSYSIPYIESGNQLVEAGASITFAGCGLTDEVQLQFLQGDDGAGAVVGTAAPVSDCYTSQVHYVIPELDRSEAHTMQLVHPDGSIVPLSEKCLTESGDTGGCLDLAVIAIHRGTP